MAKTDLLNTRLSRRGMMLAGLAALALNGAVSPLAHAHGLPRPKPQGARKRFLVMLDPGHGGIDSGAIGHTGSLEKHVVLAIAKNVRAQLDRHGIDAR
ncbi:N-acetylmuramoyl-L-alanine amidase, partial [Serratia marcescens]